MRYPLLLIEDDSWLAESYCRALAGYECRVATSPPQAIRMVDELLPEVIVADVMLGGGMVIDLLHELQSYSDTGRIPVVLCSSIAAAYRLEDMRSYGVVSILDKAELRPSRLRQAVEVAINNRNRECVE